LIFVKFKIFIDVSADFIVPFFGFFYRLTY
jgi:hypothetical protein